MLLLSGGNIAMSSTDLYTKILQENQAVLLLEMTFTARFGGHGFCSLELASGLSLNRRNHQCATL